MTEIIPPFKMSEKNKTLSELQLKSKNQTGICNFNNCCCVICRRDAVTVGWCRAGVTDCDMLKGQMIQRERCNKASGYSMYNSPKCVELTTTTTKIHPTQRRNAF